MAAESYNRLERVFHRLVLGSRTIQQVSFELETMLHGNAVNLSISESPVFVCGLARSGTTTMMNVLYETGYFESSTYRDMPFVLMKGTWNRLSSHFHHSSTLKERAHKDSILVGFDSPEAFEEVFWRVFGDDQHHSSDFIGPHNPELELIKKFRFYMALIASASGVTRRYLSKNNSNLLRLNSLAAHLPNACVLLMYRDPLETAASLLRQHIVFCEAQTRDKFVLEYMNWLGHYEFGLGHKRFQFVSDSWPEEYAPTEPDYWLAYWISIYRYVLDSAPNAVTLISYEDLCQRPEVNLSKIFLRIGLNVGATQYSSRLRLSNAGNVPQFLPALEATARNLFAELRDDERNISRL